MKNQLKKILLLLMKYRIHFIAWFFFIFYEIVLTGILRGYFASFGNYFVFYVFNIFLFYFHAHIVLPASYKQPNQTFWLLPLLVIIEVVIYVPLTIGTVALLQQYAELTISTKAAINKTSIGNGVWRAIYFILFSSGYYYLNSYFRERKNAQQAEKERLWMIIENQTIQSELIKTQYAHLKAQINPHFLFNTLSFIYTNIRKTSPEGAEAVLSLSEMMRFALRDETENTLIPVPLEIEQIENLIKLHTLKSGSPLNLTLKYDKTLDNIEIIPLVMLTLAENIFKHGDLTQPDKPAIMSVSFDGNTILIETSNYINSGYVRQSHNIGLDNTVKRLKLIYGDNAVLSFNRDSTGYFNLYVRINLFNPEDSLDPEFRKDEYVPDFLSK
jgi:two-component system LytT family sensor kinase